MCDPEWKPYVRQMLGATIRQAPLMGQFIWRCKQGHLLEDTDCTYAPLFPGGPPIHGSSYTRSNTATNDTMEWELIADDMDSVQNDSVVYDMGQSGGTLTRTLGSNESRTLHDFGINPGETYHYAMRLTINGTTSSLIPLGTVTAPPDLGIPWIVLHGDKEMITTSPYVEPGYDAVDNYDLALTDEVVVSGAVDHTIPGKYYIYYDVTDSSGNAADRVYRSVTISGTSTYAADNPPPAPNDIYRMCCMVR